MIAVRQLLKNRRAFVGGLLGSLAGLMLLLLLGSTRTLNTLPANNASLISDLQTFLRDEAATRDSRAMGDFVYSGGICTSSCTGAASHTIGALVGQVGGYALNESAITRTYGVTSGRVYVFAHQDDTTPTSFDVLSETGSSCTFSARSGRFVFINCAAGSSFPVLLDGGTSTRSPVLPLQYVDTNASQVVTAIQDLRPSNPNRTRWINVRDPAFGARGDGTTDDAAAFVAATAAVPVGGTLYIPAANHGVYYRLNAAWTVTRAIRILCGGYRVGGSLLHGSVIRQERAGTPALLVDGSAAEIDGLSIQDCAIGHTSSASGSYGLELNAVNRSSLRNVFILGGSSGLKTTGFSLLNTFDNIRISAGFTSGLGYAVPAIGFDLSSQTGPNTWLNCGVAGVTTSPGVGMDLAGANTNTFIAFEFENNTIGIRFSGDAGGNIFYSPYHEGNGTIVSGTTTSATNLSIGSTIGASATLEFGSSIGATLLATASGAFQSRTGIQLGLILSPFTAQQGTLHVSRTGVTNVWNTSAAEGGVPVFGHTDTSLANVMLMQLMATGVLADSDFRLGSRSANLGDIGMAAFRRSTGIARNIYVTRLVTDVIATANLPAAGVSEDGRVIIEDAGAGDRNLIIYAGSQRFRIDGGVPF